MSRGSVRLSGGELKGVALTVPRGVRPSSGRLREALIDAWRARLDGARLLDLFAGSGAVGLEALGQGAAALVGVEADAGVARNLRQAYARWGGDRARVLRGALPEALGRVTDAAPYDLVFADPPYEFDAFEALLAGCEPLLDGGGELALEHSSRAELPAAAGGLVRHRERRYGESVLSFYRRRMEGE